MSYLHNEKAMSSQLLLSLPTSLFFPLSPWSETKQNLNLEDFFPAPIPSAQRAILGSILEETLILYMLAVVAAIDLRIFHHYISNYFSNFL